MVLLAAVFGLLHRYSGDEDIVVGTPVSNRERIDLEDQIGLYLNTLALRVGFGARPHYRNCSIAFASQCSRHSHTRAIRSTR